MTQHSELVQKDELPCMSYGNRFFCGLAELQPDWYFDDRHTNDIPGLMIKVYHTLMTTPEMQKQFSFER